MRIRESSVKGFLIALALTLIPVSASSVQKIATGASCKVYKQKATFQNKNYVCIKSGKKLVWGKGVTKVSPTPTISDATTKPLSLDNLDYEQVYGNSRAEVSRYIAAGVSIEGAINFQAGENVDVWRIGIAKNEVNSAEKLWSSFFKPSTVTIIWYSSKDIAWAKTKYEAAGGNPALAVGFNECTPQYCGNASASLMGGGKFLFEQGLEFKDQGLWNRSTAAHEYTHLAQYGLGAPTNLNAMPWWSVEGGATFYGEAIGYAPFDSLKITRSGMHTQFVLDSQAYVSSLFVGQSLKSLLLKNDPEITKRLMKSLEVSTNLQGAIGLSYLLGSYATEVLVALYGHDKMANFYSSFATSSNYQSNFSSVFGINLETFYTKLTPYLFSMLAELN